MNQLSAALAQPVWPLFLGRKAFVPAVPVRLPDLPSWGSGLRSQSLEEALRTYPWLIVRDGERAPRVLTRARLVIEDERSTTGESRMDVPVSFLPLDRRYQSRFVRTMFIDQPPDAMSIERDMMTGSSPWTPCISHSFASCYAAVLCRPISVIVTPCIVALCLPSRLGGISDARNQFGMLYRVESTSGGTNLLIHRRREPGWSRLPDGYLRDSINTIKRIDGPYANIAEGQRLLFRLRANPTRRISDRSTTQEERWRGKRVELRREADQLQWLVDKGKRSGFALLAVRALPGRESVADVRATGTGDRVIGRTSSHRLTFASVTFEGRLCVTDPVAFQQALWHGIGSGKAFGFGLLSIAPDSA